MVVPYPILFLNKHSIPTASTDWFYCLRTLYSRAPCHDNFWEEKKVQSVECKFYRYLRFMDHGKVTTTTLTISYRSKQIFSTIFYLFAWVDVLISQSLPPPPHPSIHCTQVLYSLETTEPEVLARSLSRGVGVANRVFEGTYSVCRREVGILTLTLT